MTHLHKIFSAMFMLLAIMGLWSCEKEDVKPSVNIPSIGIQEPEFDKATMTLNVLVAPSSDATAWYWAITAQGAETTYTKVASAAADEVSAKVESSARPSCIMLFLIRILQRKRFLLLVYYSRVG